MSDIVATEADLARDLSADLAEFERLAAGMPEWVGGTMRECDLASRSREVTGPALRRAMVAEYRAECLAGECHALRLENATLREDVRGVIDRECSQLAGDLAEANAKLAAVSEAFSQLHPTLWDRFEGTRAWPLVQALANALLGRDEGCGEGEGGCGD